MATLAFSVARILTLISFGHQRPSGIAWEGCIPEPHDRFPAKSRRELPRYFHSLGIAPELQQIVYRRHQTPLASH